MSESVSGDVYLVWATGSFTDPYGMESAGTSSMWMVMPAGSPTTLARRTTLALEPIPV